MWPRSRRSAMRCAVRGVRAVRAARGGREDTGVRRGSPGPAGIRRGAGLGPRLWTGEPYLQRPAYPGPNYSPVDPAYSFNVTAVSPDHGSPLGTYCLSPGSGIDASHAILVTSVVERGPQPNAELEPVQESAPWRLGGPDCRAGTLEVRTYGYVEESGEIKAVPDKEVAFSFVIP